MVFDGTVTLGTVFQIVAMFAAVLVAWMKIDARLASFAANLDHHAVAIERHTLRLDAIDGRLFSIVSDLQRLIGRTEATNDK